MDPISDMLTRIRNASQAGHAEVLMPFSGFKLKIARALEKKEFIEKVEVIEESPPAKSIKVVLKYMRNEKGGSIPYIQGLRRVSRPGQRIYARKGDVPFSRGKFGFALVSTSKGLMTNDEARKSGIGGEIICEIW
ncbi:MAG: 30S ribosomal protein S8 [Patescibacteria group bacterium]|nr:30S ribosomal protein S8 [Patescibacteria group bacterium]